MANEIQNTSYTVQRIHAEFGKFIDVTCPECGCIQKTINESYYQEWWLKRHILRCRNCAHVFAWIEESARGDLTLVNPMFQEEDPVAKFKRIVKETYSNTPAAEVDALLEEISRWRRKVTIATNKLEAAQKKLEKLSYDNAVKLSCAPKESSVEKPS